MTGCYNLRDSDKSLPPPCDSFGFEPLLRLTVCSTAFHAPHRVPSSTATQEGQENTQLFHQIPFHKSNLEF